MVLLAFVAGTFQAFPQRLNSLPSGSREKVKAYELGQINRFQIELTEVEDDFQTVVQIPYCSAASDYSRSMGTLEDAVLDRINHDLAIYAAVGDVHGEMPGESRLFFVHIEVFADYGPRLTPDGSYASGVGTKIDAHTPVFSFTKDAEGGFVVPPEAAEFRIDYFKYYLGIQAPGVKWVEVAAYLLYGGEEYVEKTVTRNGADASHWASQLYGNGIVYLPAGEMAGLLLEELWAYDPSAYETVTLYYNEEQTDYDQFDVLSGQLIGSSAPRLAIGWYGSRLRVSLAGIPGKSYVLESSTRATWPQANLVGVLTTDGAGTASHYVDAAEPLLFFRAREALGGDD